MKKWLQVACLLLLILLACIYLLIPNQISIHRKLTIEANAQASFRTLLDGDAWDKWWPGEKKMKDGHLRYYYNGYFFAAIDQKINALVISVTHEEFKATTVLNFFSDRQGEVVFFWEGEVPATLMPGKRITYFFEARSLEKTMGTILHQLGAYFSKPDQFYSIHIKEEQVRDSILVSTYEQSIAYPSTDLIYRLIHQLKNYTASQNAHETGLPMLNVSTSDSLHYVTRVALPVDRKLNSSGTITFKGMLGGGKILVAEIKGGPAAIQEGFRQLELYVNDNKRIAPAIPFQSLVTDRSAERDTSKWITRLYYPVM